MVPVSFLHRRRGAAAMIKMETRGLANPESRQRPCKDDGQAAAGSSGNQKRCPTERFRRSWLR
jgi:hypothetical protein